MTENENLTWAEEGVANLLLVIGEDITREGLKDTPRRFVKAFQELTQGYQANIGQILSTTFCEEDIFESQIKLSNIAFTSLCEHHLLPFSGSVDISYVPNGKIVGISKLARLVAAFSQRLQIQERLTNQIGLAIKEHLNATDIQVIVRARHQCMGIRGVKNPTAEMITEFNLKPVV